MKLVLNIFFCLLAGLLVYAAPNTYDYGFCVLVLVLFLLNVIYYFVSKQTVSGNVANFDFFFITSLASCEYPVAIITSKKYPDIFSARFFSTIPLTAIIPPKAEILSAA